MGTGTDLGSRLAVALRSALDRPGLEVRGLERLSGGASRETWAFQAVMAPGGSEPMILQRERPGRGTGQIDMTGEAALLVLAARTGVPVPEVVASGDGSEGDLGAAWMVTRRVGGETIPRRLLRDERFAGVRPVLAHQAGAALGRIHAMPTEPLGGVLAEVDQLAFFRDVLDLFDEAHPAFELGFRWLEHRRPPAPSTPSVVHGDFRTGNLVVAPDGLGAVIDWELAHLGDPVEDLGWFCVRAWRFGSPLRAGGFGSLEQLLEGYAATSGRLVDPDAVRWWEALGTLKWGIMCMVQASTHLGGASRSVELATIGRRTCENEYDLLALIR